MSKRAAFGKVLARIREEQGFPTAHGFHRGAGGAKTLGCSFRSYWDLERGKSLPRGWRLKAIIAALGLARDSSEARELIVAYLSELSGCDELLDVLGTPPQADLPSRQLAEEISHLALRQRSANLSLEQWAVRSRDLGTHLCQTFLANTSGWVTVRELSEATGLPRAAVSKSLKTLAATGLVKLSGDRARSLFSSKFIKRPPITPETAPVWAALRRHWKTWLSGAKEVGTRAIVARMTAGNLERYRRRLEETVDVAGVYEDQAADRDGSAIFWIGFQVFQVFPRE